MNITKVSFAPSWKYQIKIECMTVFLRSIIIIFFDVERVDHTAVPLTSAAASSASTKEPHVGQEAGLAAAVTKEGAQADESDAQTTGAVDATVSTVALQSELPPSPGEAGADSTSTASTFQQSQQSSPPGLKNVSTTILTSSTSYVGSQSTSVSSSISIHQVKHQHPHQLQTQAQPRHPQLLPLPPLRQPRKQLQLRLYEFK